MDSLDRALRAKGVHGFAQVVDHLRGTLLRAGQVEIGIAAHRAHEQFALGHLGPDVAALGHAVEPGIDAPHQQQLSRVLANGQGVDLVIAKAFGAQDLFLRAAQADADLVESVPRLGEAVDPLFQAEECPLHGHDRRDPGEAVLAARYARQRGDQVIVFLAHVFLRPGPGQHVDFHRIAGLGHGRHGDIADDSVAPGIVDERQRRCIEDVQFNDGRLSARRAGSQQRQQ